MTSIFFRQSKRLQVLHQRFYSSVSAARGCMLSLSVVHAQPRLNVKILVQNFSGVSDGGYILPCTPLWVYAPVIGNHSLLGYNFVASYSRRRPSPASSTRSRHFCSRS